MLCSAYQQGGYYARCTRWHYWLDHLGCHHHCCTSPVGRRLAKPSEQPVQCWKTCCTGSGRAGHALCYVLANHRRSYYATWRRRHRCRDGHSYHHRFCASILGHRLAPNTSSPAHPYDRARRLRSDGTGAQANPPSVVPTREPVAVLALGHRRRLVSLYPAAPR